MTSDIGSKHSPDVEARLAAARLDGNGGSSSASEPQRSAEDVAEMEWLCSLIGCASPWKTKATKSSSASASASSSAAAVPATAAPMLRVSLLDDRVYLGRLHCVDASANLVLSSVTQEKGVIADTPVGGFAVSQVLIAWKLVRKLERVVAPSGTAASTAAAAPTTAATVSASAATVAASATPAAVATPAASDAAAPVTAAVAALSL